MNESNKSIFFCSSQAIHEFSGTEEYLINVPTIERSKISLDSAVIPYAWYSIMKNIDLTFTITPFLGVDIQSSQVVIWPGSYTAYDLEAVLSFKYNELAAHYMDVAHLFTFTYDKVLNSFKFTRAPFYTVTIQALGAACIGIPDGTHTINNEVSNTLPINLNPIRYLRVCIDEITSRSHTSGGLEGKIFAHLPVYGLPMSVLSWKDQRQESITVEPCSSFRVSLRDQNGGLVNMNGIHWSFCLLARKYELEHTTIDDLYIS